MFMAIYNCNKAPLNCFTHRQDHGFILRNVQQLNNTDSFALHTNRPMNDYDTLPYVSRGSDDDSHPVCDIQHSHGPYNHDECEIKGFKSLDVKDCGDCSHF